MGRVNLSTQWRRAGASNFVPYQSPTLNGSGCSSSTPDPQINGGQAVTGMPSHNHRPADCALHWPYRGLHTVCASLLSC